MVVAVVDRPWTLAAPSAGTWLALGALALFGTAVAYIVFFEILVRAGGSNVMLVTLLIPVTALLLGNLKVRKGVPPKLIIFNGVLGGARAPHCQERRLQRDRFATTMTILNRSDCFGAARAGSEWPARHAHSSACPNA